MDLYKVTSSKCGYDEFNSIAVYADSDTHAVEIVRDWLITMEHGPTYQADDPWVAVLIPAVAGVVHTSFRTG